MDNVKTYEYQITIDCLKLNYERLNDYKSAPTIYVVGSITAPDGSSQKCDMILPGIQQRFELIIAELYLNGFDGDVTESHFEALTILFDMLRGSV